MTQPESVHFYFGKNACSFQHTFGVSGVVSQQSELCIFRCAASAAHFLLGGNEMVKLYFKKLLFTILFVVIFALLSGICVFFWHLIFRNLFPESVRDIACIILGCLLSFKLLFTFRYERSSYKSAYVDSFTGDTFSFVKDFKNTFKSKDNIVHTLAYLPFDLVQTVRGAISSDSPFFRAVIITVILVSVRCLIFAVLNTLIWCLVHKKWMRFLRMRNS